MRFIYRQCVKFIVEFDKDKTVSIIFDTEWYVPPEDRVASVASLKVNPAKHNHTFLGGIFLRFFPLNDNNKPEKYEFFVNGMTANEEKGVLHEVYSFFLDTWKLIADKKPSDPDLITIGTGISRLDIPGLYARSVVVGLDQPNRLYETFLKTKIVDLSEASIPYFDKNRPRLLYPVATNSIAKRFGLGSERKETGKSVWDMADAEDFDGIRNRVSAEVEVLWKIYGAMVKKIFKS